MVSTTTTTLPQLTIATAEAAAIETAEARAWADVYAAAPAAFRQAVGMDTTEIAGARVIRWTASGRRYFSRAIGLGVTEAATPDAIDAVLGWFDAHGISMFLVQSLPYCRPSTYDDSLRERGLEPFDAQDRIVRDARPLEPLAQSGRGIAVERVTDTTADDWSEFIQRVYRLDTGDWLPLLIGRPGWHQYIAREDGQIVAARGMYVGPDGLAWLGMDGPVPGLGTDDYEPDAAICSAIVADAPALGATRLLADIEAPSLAMDTPAYANFAAL